MWKHCIVTGLADRFHQSLGRCIGWVKLDKGTVGHQVDMRRPHTRRLLESIFDMMLTGRTRHSNDW
jgi:hypothetical protein